MSRNQKPLFLRALDPTFVIAILATVGFYVMVHQPRMRGTMLYLYTTEHAIEYVIVALFIWGLVDVVMKLVSFPREMLALRHELLPPRGGREPVENAKLLLERVRAAQPWLQQSRFGRRILQALGYVVEKGSVEEFRDYLQYLADNDEENKYANYTLMRFVVGVTPILGLAGTVVHFGTALSGISFDKLTDQLQLVVSEMGTAFNTTTIALAAAITTMFSMFVCERIERNIVRSIDRFIERELSTRFETKDPHVAPLLAMVQSANEDALRAISTTLQRLIETWTQTLDRLFQRFDERQRKEIQGWESALQTLEQRHETYDLNRGERLRQSLAALESKQEKHLDQIQSLLERVVSVKRDMGEFVKTLQGLAHGDERLAELQAAVGLNLQMLGQTQQLLQERRSGTIGSATMWSGPGADAMLFQNEEPSTTNVLIGATVNGPTIRRIDPPTSVPPEAKGFGSGWRKWTRSSAEST